MFFFASFTALEISVVTEPSCRSKFKTMTHKHVKDHYMTMQVASERDSNEVVTHSCIWCQTVEFFGYLQNKLYISLVDRKV